MGMIPALFATIVVMAFVAWAHLTARDALRRLAALRAACWLRNEKGQLARYADASDAVRARAEL